MDPLHRIAERKIEEAVARGELDGLSTQGKPLELEDLGAVPEELRGGYIVLKSAGVLPEELDLRRSIRNLEDLLARCRSDDEARQIRSELGAQRLRYELLMERRGITPATAQYAAQVRARLER